MDNDKPPDQRGHLCPLWHDCMRAGGLMIANMLRREHRHVLATGGQTLPKKRHPGAKQKQNTSVRCSAATKPFFHTKLFGRMLTAALIFPIHYEQPHNHFI